MSSIPSRQVCPSIPRAARFAPGSAGRAILSGCTTPSAPDLPAEDDPGANPLNKRHAVVQLVALAAGAAVALWLVRGDGLGTVHRIVASLKPTPSSIAASPSPPPRCRGGQLVLRGSLNTCADTASQTPAACGPVQADSFFGVALFHDDQHGYLFYVEVDGGYHGAGAYTLVPWPHPSLGVRDGAAKVAFRDDASGALWQSVSGSVTIDPGANSGSVRADLVFIGERPIPSVKQMTVDGPWRCG